MLKKVTVILLVLTLVLSLAACGSDSKKETVQDLSFDYSSSGDCSGNVSIACGDLALDMIGAAADAYAEVQPGVTVSASVIGHDASIQSFVDKGIDLLILSADTSREQDEQIVGAYGDGQAVQLRFATDGIAMIVNKDNDWVDYISKNEILAIYTAGLTKPDDDLFWSDVREGWPDEKITICGTDENDDLNCYFKKLVLADKDFVSSLTTFASKEEVLSAVEADKNAIAFVSLSAYLRNADRVTGLAVDFGKGAKEPTIENVLGSGSIMGPYAQFSFPIYLYVGRSNSKENPQVFDFVRYLLSSSGAMKLAGELNYIPLTEDDYVNQIGTLAY